MKKFILSIFSLSLFALIAVAADFKPITERYSNSYSQYAESNKMESLVPLLEGATIRFSDFDNNKEITCFKLVVPDTIWIKERPKKNPKEGKHYTLRYLYHSELATTNYSYIKNETYERTPAIEFVGAQFNVNRVEPLGNSSYYSSDYDYKIYLTNIATGEQLIWTYLKDSTSRTKCIVHLVSLSDELDLAGQTLYSAMSEGYLNDRFSSITKHNVISADAQINLTNIYPKFLIRFTTIDENNNKGTYSLPLESRSSYLYNNSLVWLDESQADAARNSSRTYDIDYFVRLDSPHEFPFSFAAIPGIANEYITYAYQSLKPVSYQNYDAFINQREIMLIGDKINVRGKDYYKAVIEGKAFYVPCSNVKLSPEGYQKLDSLINSPQNVRDAFFEYTKMLSYLGYISDIENALAEIKGHAAKGISIPSWGVYDMSEYTDGTGIRFSFHNPTNKTIKYINVSFVGYNAVDDRVGKAISKKCIGPIEPDETASYDFEYAWFTDVVEYAKITSLSVQYRDGTTKTVANPRSVVWTDDASKALSSSSSVSNLKMELVKTGD